jgi:hypothetical protein
MLWAVRVYERIRKRNAKRRLARPEDYLRLLYVASIDTLKLARNTRTSPEIIDRCCPAPLTGEMAILELAG